MKHMLLLRTVCLMVGVGPICAQGGLDPAVGSVAHHAPDNGGFTANRIDV